MALATAIEITDIVKKEMKFYKSFSKRTTQLQPLNPTKKILIVTGEASGDHHAAAMVTEAHKLDPTLQFFGMGGEHMRQAGVEIIIDSKPMAVVGGIEIAQHFCLFFALGKNSSSHQKKPSRSRGSSRLSRI